MSDETLSIFREQISKLPKSVVIFLQSSGWEIRLQELIRSNGLTPDQADDFNTESALVLAGIVHPDAFGSALIEHANLPETLANTLVQEFEQRILAPIRPALLEFFEKERAEAEAHGGLPEEGIVATAEATPKSVAPANLPTEAAEPLLPPITPKVVTPKTTEPETILMHPFEEKLQRAPISTPVPVSAPMPSTFTPATPIAPQSVQVPAMSSPLVPQTPQGALAFTPASNGSARGTITHDPYREPVE
jgi:hypothetical protein